ncbi:DUF1036 domain-containing protein [Desulfobulbus sp. TB]|nr:DUF1036 domain-containing protein [Desulfobulbus sp. TB]
MKTSKSIVLASIFLLSFVFSLEQASADIWSKAANSIKATGRKIDPGPAIGSAVRTQFNKYYEVKVKNKCNKTISVAIHYMPILDGQSGAVGAKGDGWTTEGYWKLRPGEKKFIATTRNRNIYFHATSNSGKIWGNSKHQWKVNRYQKGKDKFFEKSMGSSFKEYTQSFTCK